MGLTRRTFIQQMGWALTTLGVSESLVLWADRYQQAIAQPTRRKLALLIGINQYAEQVCDYAVPKGSVLNGSVTDVALQQELLIHRFGFQPSDILTLTDQQATRQSILDAFQAHLVQQARPGDAVVFHFSGLGSRIRLEGAFEQAEPNGSNLEYNSFVPVDGWLPTPENPVIHDIPEETLGWLLRSISTDQIITILDTSHTSLGRTLQGNLRIRSRPSTPSGRLDELEEVLQDQLSRETGISKAKIHAQWRSGQVPGLLLSAAHANQIAAEAQWSGFSAGLLTYALTQQLWWATPATTLYFVPNSIGFTRVRLDQASQLLSSGIAKGFASSPNADGVIHAVDEEGKAQVWLAGLPAAVLENYGASVLAISSSGVSPQSSTQSLQDFTHPTLHQIRSREGLMFKTRLISEADRPLVGQWVQEQVRILPRSVGLTVAIDASLERIERVDATSAFSAIPRVSSVIAGEQPADFLFGKNQSAYPLTASLDPSTPSAQNGYGLFYPSRDAILSTLIQDDEAVKTAVNRVTPELKTLLATKWLRLTENQGSSRLGVRVTLERVGLEPISSSQIKPQPLKPQALMHRETVRSIWTAPESDPALGDAKLTLSVGSQIQYRLANYGDRPVYFVLLGLNAAGNAIAFYPGEADMLEQTILAPGESVTVPPSEPGWKMQTAGLAEIHVVFCSAPLTQTYQTLATTRPKTDTQRVVLLTNPLEVVQALLQDLHQASAPLVLALPKVEVPADTYALDVNTWATLSFVHQVV
ncbi:MAG: caspase family protein [Drouetiella hepatica Uher 2000/2452]|jgi:hypothetical protein|uniref:Caspase family protein n=1 Tax=Drouetiella hepatica Uher 2000/2452 TaxID=904376 RepID=A0A951QGD6_9CYAN|nr:caspase family protein [Drouetiella hepatica Uher 2000/2452]